MQLRFRANVDVFSNILQFFGGLSAPLRYWREVASAIDAVDQEGLSAAGQAVLTHADAHQNETQVASVSGSSITFSSRGEVQVTIARAEGTADSVTKQYLLTVEFTQKGSRLTLAFVAFIFDMKEFWWLPISLDDRPPLLAAMLHQSLAVERLNTLMSGFSGAVRT